jgi:hypothetical protein
MIRWMNLLQKLQRFFKPYIYLRIIGIRVYVNRNMIVDNVPSTDLIGWYQLLQMKTKKCIPQSIGDAYLPNLHMTTGCQGIKAQIKNLFYRGREIDIH